jgi:hypothetical protein
MVAKKQAGRGRMTGARGTVLVACLGLWACAQTVAVPAPAPEDLTAEVTRVTGAAPPSEPRDACWGRDTIPAVIETVTDTALIQPEERDAAGKLTHPASYSSVSRQRMVHDREDVWIRTPCYNQLTPDTIITLQRALKARGYYLAPLTGALDDATQTAIRRYQADHGLDTKVLSLKAAQNLGLVATVMEP